MKIAACLIAVSLSVGAVAQTYQESMYSDYPAMPRLASSYQETVTGAVQIGYDTRYAYKDVAVSSRLNEGGVFRAGGELTLNLINQWKQDIELEYLAFCDGVLEHNNAFNGAWKAHRELFPNLHLRAGYEFNYGGLPGYLSKALDKTPHSFAQSLTVGLKYEEPLMGFFGAVDVQYGFYGMVGWRIDMEAGKRWNAVWHDRVDMKLSAGTGYSCSYWGPGVDGFDQFNIKLAAPIRVTGTDDRHGLQVLPFVQVVWGCHTRGDIRYHFGSNVISACNLRAGVNVQYRF